MSIWAEYAEDYWKRRRLEAFLSTGAAWEPVLQKKSMYKLGQAAFGVASSGDAVR